MAIEKGNNSDVQSDIVAPSFANNTDKANYNNLWAKGVIVGGLASLGLLGYSFYKFENKKEIFPVVGIGVLSGLIAIAPSDSANPITKIAPYVALSTIPYAISRGIFQKSINTSLIVSAASILGLYFYSKSKEPSKK